MKILFFTESLTCGGKERRILELIRYLKENTDYSIALVLTESIIHYEYVYKLGIPIKIIQRKGIKYDPLLFLKFYRYCLIFKPDIIHTWGRMTTFYAIPSKIILGIPLISSMIADAQQNYNYFSLKNLFFKTDILFSNILLSNSDAGIKAYKIKTHKAKVIFNGVNLDRFERTFDSKGERDRLGVRTQFMVVMVAAFSSFKDYDLFLDIAKRMYQIRNDVTFVAVGSGPNFKNIRQRIEKEKIANVILTGKQDDVERIIAASDVGLLCTYCEGISNSIIESMALCKPVISTDLIGGSKEIILEGETGYCTERNIENNVEKINYLFNNQELRISMGIKGKERINTSFSIERMGKDYEIVYQEAYTQKVQ